MHEEQQAGRSLARAIESGAALTGASGGAAVGAALGGPAGAAVGGGVGWITEELLKAGGEIVRRLIAPRAVMRLGAMFRLIDDEISARIMAGEKPRDDFGTEMAFDRSPASELAEAALLAAAHTYEERKLPYIAHLFAAIVFEPDLTHAHANQMIGIAQALTYRQFVALSVYAELPEEEVATTLRGEGSPYWEEDPEVHSLRIDLLDLFHTGLLSAARRTKRYRRERSEAPRVRGLQPRGYKSVTEDLPWPAIPTEIDPSGTALSSAGMRLVRMMRLSGVDPADREELVLSRLRSARGN
jgi:hypothetical protein